MQKLQCKLKSHRLHVRLLKGTGDVHVHVQEPLHGTTLLSLNKKVNIESLFKFFDWSNDILFGQIFKKKTDNKNIH